MTAVLIPELTPDQRCRAGRDILTFRHRLDETGLFSDAALARLIDETPGEDILIRTPGRRSAEPWMVGEVGLSKGCDLLAAARRSTLWIEIPVVQNIRYARVFDRLMDEFANRMRLVLVEADARVIIASPNLSAAFHVDATETMILHVRGNELMQVHAPRGPQLEEERLEAILRQEAPGDLSGDLALRRGATPVPLAGGEAAWWPLHSPHRTVTGEALSVSLSVIFASPKTRQANGVVYTNSFLRRTLGLNPVSRLTPKMIQPLYLAVSEVLRRLARPVRPTQLPAARFLVDVTTPSCIRWRRNHADPVRRAA